MAVNVPFPLFELYGPPCLTEGCVGVGTLSATKANKFKDARYRCSKCDGDCAYPEPVPFQYKVVASWDEREQAFVARIPALPGVSVDAPTEEAAIREACEVGKVVLEDLAERGRPLPESDL